MNPWSFTINIITAGTVSALLTGLLLWLTKSWISERLKNAIKHEYDEKLESHKSMLKAQSEVELEKLRSQLRGTSFERETLFTRLHKDRADVISETYDLLKNLFTKINQYIQIFEPAGISPREERGKAAAEAHHSFQTYYSRKLIFFPKRTAEALEKLDQELISAFNQFYVGVDLQRQADSKTADKWVQIVQRVNGDIKSALRDLEDDFRRLMGDS